MRTSTYEAVNYSGGASYAGGRTSFTTFDDAPVSPQPSTARSMGSACNGDVGSQLASPASYSGAAWTDSFQHFSPRPQEAFKDVEEKMRTGHVLGVGGSPFGDWVFFILNSHVLLAAIGFAHPSHPYPLQRRRLVCATSLSFAFFLASCLLLAGYVRPTVPSDYGVTKRVLNLLRDWPTTLSVALQVVWDVGAGATMRSCPCARIGPPALRKPCGLGMLCCLACQQVLLGVVYLAAGIVLLVIGALFYLHEARLHAVQRFIVLLLETKGLAYVMAVPAATLIFFAVRDHELKQLQQLKQHASQGGGGGGSSNGSTPREYYGVPGTCPPSGACGGGGYHSRQSSDHQTSPPHTTYHSPQSSLRTGADLL